MSTLALDTSVSIPLLVRSHSAHAAVRRSLGESTTVLTAQSLVETYSVLTRLPGDARLAPADAARLIESNFETTLMLDAATVAAVPDRLAMLSIAGGAVYDALVGLAAAAHGIRLGSRDARALGTYTAVGASVEVIGG